MSQSNEATPVGQLVHELVGSLVLSGTLSENAVAEWLGRDEEETCS